MKNKEKFAKEIVEIAIKSQSLSVNQEGEINCCQASQCKNCIFYQGAGRCCDKRKDWAESEYVEPKEFTKEEKAILIALPKVKWVAKSMNKEVLLFVQKPVKTEVTWSGGGNGNYIILSLFSDAKFSAIKWEDTEPTSREEILR